MKNILRDASGTFYLWFSVLIPVLLSIAAFLYLNTSRTNLRTELRVIADAAATAGAATLCSRADCYNDSLDAMLQILNRSSFNSNGRQKINLPSAPNVAATADEVGHWAVPDQHLKVWIERGMWVNVQAMQTDTFDCVNEIKDSGSSQERCFESFENDWQVTRPGIPIHVAANSVRIRIEVSNFATLFSAAFSAGEGQVSVLATALVGDQDPVEVAPFALPVCSLLDSDGEFKTKELARGDRIFTGIDRYLPNQTKTKAYGLDCSEATARYYISNWPNPGYNAFAEQYGYKGLPDPIELGTANYSDNALNCKNTTPRTLEQELGNDFGIKPNFVYGPCSESLNECNLNRILNLAYGDLNDNTKNALGWANYAYTNFADHYGVVGSTTGAKTEAALLTSLGQNRTQTAKIGSLFYPIKDGFTSKATENFLWDYILTNGINAKGINGNPSTDIGDLNNITGKIVFSTNQNANFFGRIEGGNPPYVGYTFPLKSNYIKKTLTSNITSTDESYFYVPETRYPSYGAEMNRRDMQVHGICNSRRVKLGCEVNGEFKTIGTGANEVEANDCANDINDYFDLAPIDVATPSYRKVTDFIKAFYGKSFQLGVKPQTENIWQIKIPVIADPARINVGDDLSNIYLCEGVNGIIDEIKLPVENDTVKPMLVIGFVKVNIFDMDIGTQLDPTNWHSPFSQYLPPYLVSMYKMPLYEKYVSPNGYDWSKRDRLAYTAARIPPSAGFNFFSPYYTVDILSNEQQFYALSSGDLIGPWSAYQSNYYNYKVNLPMVPTGPPTSESIPFLQVFNNKAFGYGGSMTGPNPWFFQVDGKPTSCNMVRARIDSSTDFIPTSQNSSEDRRLISLVQ